MKQSLYLSASLLTLIVACGQPKKSKPEEVKETQTQGLPAASQPAQAPQSQPTPSSGDQANSDLIDHVYELTRRYGEPEAFGELATKVVNEGDRKPSPDQRIKMLARLEQLKRVKEKQIQIVSDQRNLVEVATFENDEYTVHLAAGFLTMILPGSALSLASRSFRPLPQEPFVAPRFDDFIDGKLPTRDMTVREFENADMWVKHPQLGRVRVSDTLLKLEKTGATAATVASERKALYELYHWERYYDVYNSLVPEAERIWMQKVAAISTKTRAAETRARTSRRLLIVGGATLAAGIVFESTQGVYWAMSYYDKTDHEMRLERMQRQLEVVRDQLAKAQAELLEVK
jgi:hypothetical protein